jgi:hypothetical protein
MALPFLFKIFFSHYPPPPAYYTNTLQSRLKKHSTTHKVKAVDLLDNKMNEVCEKEVGVV